VTSMFSMAGGCAWTFVVVHAELCCTSSSNVGEGMGLWLFSKLLLTSVGLLQQLL